MTFPESPRVIYSKNPLEQVICQLKFPTILKIAAETPVAFQESLRQDYPIFSEQNERSIQLPQDVLQIVPQSVIDSLVKINKSAYNFTSVDRDWTIGLTEDFLALTALDYKRWEDFKKHLVVPFNRLIELYEPVFFQRIGLRYKNVIRRSDTKLDNVKWYELLKPQIAAELASIEISETVEEHFNNILIRLPDNQGKVRIQHGLGTDQTGEICYIIDSDFFLEEKVELNDVFTRLDYFNQQGRRLFRWCITDKLHEAMLPQSI